MKDICRFFLKGQVEFFQCNIKIKLSFMQGSHSSKDKIAYTFLIVKLFLINQGVYTDENAVLTLLFCKLISKTIALNSSSNEQKNINYFVIKFLV